MKTAISLLSLLLLSWIALPAQTTILQFQWDNFGANERISDIGPDGTSSGSAALSAATGSYGSPQGCRTGPAFPTSQQNIAISVPDSANVFDVPAIYLSMDHRRSGTAELLGYFFRKDGLRFGFENGKIKVYFSEDVSGVCTPLTWDIYPSEWEWANPGLYCPGGWVWSGGINPGQIPSDGNWRTFTFTYDYPNGICRVTINNICGGTSGAITYNYPGMIAGPLCAWLPGNPMIVGESLDNMANTATALDNAIVGIPVVLPISLVDFHSTSDGHQVRINWSTRTETNTKNFIISRSSDGHDWQVIGDIDAAGNSTELIQYQFSDVAPLEGTNYYRLNQIDINGNMEIFGPVEATFAYEGSGFLSLYPNPTETGNAMNISYDADQGQGTELKAFIINVAGQLVLEQDYILNAGINNLNLDVSALPPGVYMARLLHNGVTHTERFLLMQP